MGQQEQKSETLPSDTMGKISAQKVQDSGTSLQENGCNSLSEQPIVDCSNYAATENELALT